MNEEYVKPETKPWNEASMAQIIHIQALEIMKFCARIIEANSIRGDKVEKLNKMYALMNDR